MALPALYVRVIRDTGKDGAESTGLEYMLMVDRPAITICVENPRPHIILSWGLERVDTSVLLPTKNNDGVPDFSSDLSSSHLPPLVEVLGKWI